MPGPFVPSFEDLPPVIPIFPLAGALLLPGGKLPLNIFEPRYLAMTLDAVAGPRLIGMIQPSSEESGHHPPVFDTGCAGRITSFAETDDGRLLITLDGLCRFSVVEELPLHSGYRRVRPDFARWRADYDEAEVGEIDRAHLLGALKAYLAHQGISANWSAIEETPDHRLVTSLSMMCPFSPSEKQALLEAPDVAERAGVLTALLEMAVADSGGGRA